MTWSEAFAAYLKRNNIKPLDAAIAIGVSPTTVHYWTKGSEPRGERGRSVKERVQEWSHGEIPAAPWESPTESGTNVTADAEAPAKAG